MINSKSALALAFAGPAWSFNHMRIAILGILNTGSKLVIGRVNTAFRCGFVAFLQADLPRASLLGERPSSLTLPLQHRGWSGGPRMRVSCRYRGEALGCARGAQARGRISQHDTVPVVHNSPKFGSIAERRRHGGRMGGTLDLTLGSYRDYVLCCLSRMVQVCTELNTSATSM